LYKTVTATSRFEKIDPHHDGLLTDRQSLSGLDQPGYIYCGLAVSNGNNKL